MEQVLIQVKEQDQKRGSPISKPTLNTSLILDTDFEHSPSSSYSGNGFVSDLENSDLENALALSESYFATEVMATDLPTIQDLQIHDHAAFYTITTQGLALCQIHENVSYRIGLLYNLALYYYTKTAPNLKHLKTLEDVLELSPKQYLIATYYNNLAFMRLSANLLTSETLKQLKPFTSTYTHNSSTPIFTTTQIELLVAMSQLDQATEKNNNFIAQAKDSTIHNAYFHLHSYIIHQAAGNYAKAKSNIELALEAFEQTTTKCNTTIANCHHYLSELYEQLGYYTQALRHIKLANRFEAKAHSTKVNLSELERLHCQFRKKIVARRNTKPQNLN